MAKLPPGTEPPLFTPRPQAKSRVEKVYTALEGDDEFSVASVDVDSRRPTVELQPADTDSRPSATGDQRTLWRLFRKIFT